MLMAGIGKYLTGTSLNPAAFYAASSYSPHR